MSNVANIFDRENGSIGPVNIYIDPVIETGDTGTNTLLAKTQGTTLRDITEKSDIVWDQNGTSPANKVATGHTVELDASIVGATLEQLAVVIQGFTSYTGGAGGATKRSVIGQDDLTISTPIELVLLTGDVEETDNAFKLILPNAAIMSEPEWAFNAADQRVVSIKFFCYKSARYTDTATGGQLYYFTRDALDAGNVTIVTAETK